MSEVAECFETWGGAFLPLSHVRTPTQIFQNALCVVRWRKQTSLQPSQCTMCQ